jgi:hypothetical protein
MGTDLVESLIRVIRGQRVILDADLAQVYGVPTRQLNQAVRRNPEKFPEDFAFQLDSQEVINLRSQIVISSRHGGRRSAPWVFTEHGTIMAANILNSPRAVQMSVFVVRAFIKMRETFAQNRELAAQLAELERNLTDRLDDHEQAIVQIMGEIKKLMTPLEPESMPRELGFHVKNQHSFHLSQPGKQKA